MLHLREFSYSILAILFSFYFSQNIKGQEITVFGVQYKPILAADALDTGPIESSTEEFNTTLSPKLGHNFGMVIRWGIHERFAIETGINKIRRNYDLKIEDNSSTNEVNSDLGLVGYEIPIRFLLYVKLGEQFYMNAAGGTGVDFFPSDLSTSGAEFKQYTGRSNWAQFALTANVGFEYRTEDFGFFYIGGSYHRPFTKIARMRVTYKPGVRSFNDLLDLQGNYITMDLRYFFPYVE